ncbi:MAG TPA: ComF family protein [Flavisolibacter sp.]|nr:ComF family protein [Flavisolibacter sp.]
MSLLVDIKEALLHLAFPHICEGCGTDIIQQDHQLCLYCLSSMPQTEFHLHPNNQIEKIFWGRVPLMHATAQYYYTKESMMQRLMHSFKYRGNKELGLYLGRLMGQSLLTSKRFEAVDVLVPLPLFISKERRRGYNQATILCNGIAEVLMKPVLNKVVCRPEHTETQTKKNRVERWQNMEGRFELTDAAAIEGKHVLLVDDVVTTGATLESCASELLKAPNVRISVATLCFSSGS